MELMTRDELAQGWDASIPENNPPFLVSDVPSDLHGLVPYAQIFGVTDDGYRHDLLDRTPRPLALHVRNAVLSRYNALSAWLVQVEANGSYTEASDAFTALLMAAEGILPEATTSSGGLLIARHDADIYWGALCKVVSEFRPLWLRVACRSGVSIEQSRWGQMLTIPKKGYLEGPDGPVPMRDVEWIELSMSRVMGGLAGRPLQIVDTKEQILAALRETSLHWDVRDSTWSIERILQDLPVQVAHFAKPDFDQID